MVDMGKFFSRAQRPEDVSKWRAQHVWSWLQGQPFASVLRPVDWRYVNGTSLLGMNQDILPASVRGNDALVTALLGAVNSLRLGMGVSLFSALPFFPFLTFFPSPTGGVFIRLVYLFVFIVAFGFRVDASGGGAMALRVADQFCVLRHALPLLFVLTCIVTFVVQNVASRHFSRRLVRARRVSVLQRKVRPRVGVVLAARWPVLIGVGCSLSVLDRWRRR
jgi:hypothetical protein